MGGLAHAIGARNLKITIVAMPLVFLVVIALIILIFGKKDKAAPIESAAAAEEQAAAPATEIAERVAISEGQTPGALALDGDHLAVRIDGPAGVEVVVYDLAKGEVIARIEFAAAPSAGRPD
ncbi:MAG: hypothetical protein DHS20C04_13580 [Hyphococcus sp.]|nr:MAG: hypothetical protein DHS20C04_13580 [Marinicaulis sp.]